MFKYFYTTYDQEVLDVNYLIDEAGVILVEVIPRNTTMNILPLLSDKAKLWLIDQIKASEEEKEENV